jgi:outer membrane protein insertion porin family
MRDAILVFGILLLLLDSAKTFAQHPENSSENTSQTVETSATNDEPNESSVDSSNDIGIEKPSHVIRSIEFVGNRKYKKNVLLQRLGFVAGEHLDLYLAESGRTTITEVYRKIGFAFVKVMLDREKLPQGRLVYTIDEGPRVRIASVKFVGNEHVKASTLKKLMKTKTRKWFYWSFYYTQEALQEDIEKLRKFYYEKGFLDYKVEVKKEFSEDNSKVHVTFLIDEGPAYRIEQIVFVGNEFFSEEKLRESLELSKGQIYLKREVDRETGRIRKLYHEQGFVDAQVMQRPKFSEQADANTVIVEFNISEGRRFRIGRIDITGNELTQDRIVRRVLDEYDFTPGQWYNANMAPKQGGGKLESYVRRMVLADEVIIRPVTPEDGDPNRMDVRIDVKEGLTGMIKPGVGISSDSGMIGQLVYEQRNFDIKDTPEDFKELITMRSFRGAGQHLRIALMPGTQVSQYSVSFREPYLYDRPTSLDLVGSSWGRWRESYDEKRLRGQIGLEQRRKNLWRRGISLRAENVEVHSLDYDAPQEIRDVKGDNMLVGIRAGTGKMATDDRYNPTMGFSFNTSYEQVAGDHTFGLLNGVYIRYITLHEDVLERKTVLATKLRGGAIIGDAPPFEKFYAGGTGIYGIRGFEYRGVSTRGLQTNVSFPKQIDPVGSDWIFLANAELTVPLIGENFSALFFVDSGTIDSGAYRLSVGGGIQIMVPQFFGPVPMRFELATPISKDDSDETQTFSFSVGGALF